MLDRLGNMEKRPEIGLKLFNSKVFLPGNDAVYQKWREAKLAKAVLGVDVCPVKLRDLSQPGKSAIIEIASRCANSNMAIYELENAGMCSSENEQKELRTGLKNFCALLGLNDAENNRSQGDDGVVAIKIDNKGVGAGYIPYTNKALSWHTDGYYNASDERIHAMVLHCARDASEGGVNELFDPEIAYIRLRDENPDYIIALMHDQVMRIPENTDTRSAYRAPSVGPVFFLDDVTGALNMRYSARSRNILWRDDRATNGAREMLGEVLAGDPLIVRHKFKPGQGIISNNVLHNRTRFKDADEHNKLAGRLLFRIRYKQRVALLS